MVGRPIRVITGEEKSLTSVAAGKQKHLGREDAAVGQRGWDAGAGDGQAARGRASPESHLTMEPAYATGRRQEPARCQISVLASCEHCNASTFVARVVARARPGRAGRARRGREVQWAQSRPERARRGGGPGVLGAEEFAQESPRQKAGKLE